MSVDKFKTEGEPDDETLFVLHDPDNLYTHSEVCDLLEEAENYGFSLEKGSELDNMTVGELDRMLHRKI